MWNMMPCPPSPFSGDCPQRETEVRHPYISPVLFQGLCWERACAHNVSLLWEELLSEVTPMTIQTECLFKSHASMWTSVTLLLLADTVISQITTVKNWKSLGLVWLPLRNSSKTLLASVWTVCLMFTHCCILMSSRALLVSACQSWKVLAALMVITCSRFWGHSCDSMFHKSYLANGDLEIP